MLRYPADLVADTNDTLLVEFPDVPEAHTYGADREEAIMRAADALETALSACVDLRRIIPQPSKLRRGQVEVKLPPLIEAKLKLYSAMREEGMSKAELARRLNWHLPQVDRVLNLNHNSQLDQMEAALRAVGKKLAISVEDAA